MFALATVVCYRRTCHVLPSHTLPDVTHLTRYWQYKQWHQTPRRPLASETWELAVFRGSRLWEVEGGNRERLLLSWCYGAARLITQPPHDLLQGPSSARRSASNLITVVPSDDSCADHAFTATAHNSRLTMAYFNTLSVHQIAGEIHDFTVDNTLDVLILTETWLQEVGDERCVKEKTPLGYVFNSFPHVGRRGGGIAVLMSN